jgi:outer membrane receptor for monomeric catechols
VKPIPQLDAMLSVSYATADKKPLNYQNGSYGWEIDATGTYKITNNLSYMLGIGYLFTGDYFKGVNNNNKTVDDYMLINRLTLSF